MQARTTIICAIWHADPDRFNLLTKHAANINKQTRPVNRIYVLDNGDDIQNTVNGTILQSPDPLTIYQSWNLALPTVVTPYVMNLNLDDRLAQDAIAYMEDALDQGGDLVGGDWRICYSQGDTDAVTPCCPANELPFILDWPPASGTTTRLGSGSTETRRTLGPACMWRASLHDEIGKFPDQFGDGTLIRVIGDSIWWRVLDANQKKIIRLPTIIGNYHSHPQTQAEFRYPALDEELILQKHGVLLA